VGSPDEFSKYESLWDLSLEAGQTVHETPLAKKEKGRVEIWRVSGGPCLLKRNVAVGWKGMGTIRGILKSERILKFSFWDWAN